MTARRRAVPRRVSPALVIGTALFMTAAAAIGVAGMWGIYEDPWLLVVAVAGVGLSLGVAALTIARGWAWWQTAILLAALYLVAGVPLAVPSVFADPTQIVPALLAVAAAPVTGPKNLLTLELPLGTYQATLAPAFLTLLVAPGAATIVGASRRRWWWAAAPIALAPAAFAVVFGATTTSAAPLAAGIALPGLREAAIGVGSCTTILLWFVWRSVTIRRLSLREAGGARPRPARRAIAGRAVVGTAMLAIGVAVAVTAAPALSAQPRTVPRALTEPVLRIAQEPSPLSGYRSMFDEDAYDTVLFTVATSGADRVRLATMSFYDGQLARVTDPGAAATDASTAFTRIPSSRTAAIGPEIRADVEIAAAEGIWVPTLGTVRAISFAGPDRAALADGFFYSAAAGMGIDTSAAFGPGTSYTIVSDAGATMDLVSAAPPRSAPALGEEAVPESLPTWIRLQDAGGGGAGLAELIERLRARGYLSHDLEESASSAVWMADLGQESFAPSRAGHSTDRIDRLFAALVERQSGALPGASDAELVAAAGDDEQFAVAAAMIADQLGFPARIVIGARLAASDETGVPPCRDGACRGQNMTAWIEVQDVSGIWIPVDVTPQHSVPMDVVVDQRRDPENATEVENERAEVVQPPDADPAQTDPRTEDEDQAAADLTALWLAVRITGSVLLVLAVLLGPLAAIVIAKAWRRRGRRRSAEPSRRIARGWDEWVDAALDRGADPPGTRTRSEYAAVAEIALASRGATEAARLAELADQASFAPAMPRESDADEFWALVDRERERMDTGRTLRARLRAALSLRSLRRERRTRRSR